MSNVRRTVSDIVWIAIFGLEVFALYVTAFWIPHDIVFKMHVPTPVAEMMIGKGWAKP